jgi:hypothetical protein
MKKLVLSSVISALFISAFAFQGVIEQVYTDAKTMEQKSFTWTIDGEKIRLDIQSGEELMTIIPDFTGLTLMMFGNKADNKGTYWYSNTPISQINVTVPKLRVLEMAESTFKDSPAKELKLMSSNGLVVVQFVETIDVNMKNMNTFFAESVEFSGISLANESGFPVSSMLLNENDAIYTLTTKSIIDKSVNASAFQVPSNYKLFTGIK